MVELKIYGVRGSCARGQREFMEYGGDTSSYTLRYGNNLHFLDGGTGISSAEKELKDAENVYLNISHGHPDHIDMGCAPALYFNKLKNGVQVVGYKETRNALEKYFDGKLLWPVPLSQMNGINKKITELEGGESVEYENCTMRTLRNFHPTIGNGGSIGFRFDIAESGKLYSISYVTDMEFDYKPGCVKNEDSEKLKKEFSEFVHGSDLLLADTHFTKDEYIDKFVRGWGHSYVEQVIDLAAKANVKMLIGTHHSPNHNDDSMRKIEAFSKDYARSLGISFEMAKQGASYIF